MDHVEADPEAVPVGRVDEALQRGRSAVHLVHGVRRHAVVPPVVPAGERREGQQLDDVDAEVDEVGSRPMAASSVPSGVNVPTCVS